MGRGPVWGLVPALQGCHLEGLVPSLSCTPHRRDDAYWPEAKRAALDERYHSDFNRQDRFHDFDHRDRGRYPNHSVDRSVWPCCPFLLGVGVFPLVLHWPSLTSGAHMTHRFARTAHSPVTCIRPGTATLGQQASFPYGLI